MSNSFDWEVLGEIAKHMTMVPCAMCGGTGRIDAEHSCHHCRSQRIRAGLVLDGHVKIPEWAGGSTTKKLGTCDYCKEPHENMERSYCPNWKALDEPIAKDADDGEGTPLTTSGGTE